MQSPNLFCGPFVIYTHKETQTERQADKQADKQADRTVDIQQKYIEFRVILHRLFHLLQVKNVEKHKRITSRVRFHRKSLLRSWSRK